MIPPTFTYPVRELVRRQTFSRPRADVFAFFERPENLARITPPWLHFRVISPSPVPMRNGQLIDYRIRVAGLSVGWTSVIAQYDPPGGFVDAQLNGPYRLWHHEHWFEEREGGTEMTDRVRYAVPGGPVEPLIHRLFVRPRLEAIFDYRAERIREILGK